MIPNADKALRMLSHRLMTALLPDMKSLYTMSDGMMVGLLMNAVADELAEGIERRLQDIAAMQAIMENNADLLHDRSLATAVPASHSLGDVNALHDSLSRALIVLHEHAEVAGDDALNAAIWNYLREANIRHRVTAIP